MLHLADWAEMHMYLLVAKHVQVKNPLEMYIIQYVSYRKYMVQTMQR